MSLSIIYFLLLGFLHPPFIVLRNFLELERDLFFLVEVRKNENTENGLYLSHLLQEDIISILYTIFGDLPSHKLYSESLVNF